MRLLICLAATMMVAAASHAAEGWTINKIGQPNSCEAAGPYSADVQLTIAVLGPQTKLLFSSDKFNVKTGTYSITVRLDDGEPLTLNALGDGGVYAVDIVPPLGMPLRSASRLTATIGQQSYAFSFRHADAAMDDAARCAGMPTLLEHWANKPKPIPGAGEWLLFDSLPGTGKCSVRHNGTEADTVLSLNNAGKLLLITGHADWAAWPGKLKATLAIDDGAAQDVDAFALDNIVIVLITDDEAVVRLRRAKTLLWHLPWGDFQAAVEGLGAAADALTACDASHATAPPG